MIEIIPQIRNLSRRIQQTVSFILDHEVDILVTIDSPGFNERVVQALKTKNPKIRCIHYVAPSVWAWKPQRAQRYANLFDHLLTLFPFEPPYFQKEGLATTFVGHPLLELPWNQAQKLPVVLASNERFILLLPGSRKQEIQKLFSIFLQSISLLKNRNYHIGVLTFPAFQDFLKKELQKQSPYPFFVTTQQSEKLSLLQNAHWAISASGTMSLELGLAGVPHGVGYYLHPLTWLWIQSFHKIQTPYVSLVNILMKEAHVPEWIQSDCHPQKIAHQIESIRDQHDSFRTVSSQLKNLLLPEEGLAPSEKAARVVMGEF